MQTIGHRQDWRDTDATGDQQGVRNSFFEYEAVAGRSGANQCAFDEIARRRQRSSSAGFLAEHCDHVPVVFAGWIEDGVRTPYPVFDLQIETRAGLALREVALRIGEPKLVGTYLVGLSCDGGDAQGQQLGHVN
ncbi:MAG: hypothetical protein AB7O43_19100 [Hyphomicrobiaceae bacterium]